MTDWHPANQQYLMAAIATVRIALERYGRSLTEPVPDPTTDSAWAKAQHEWQQAADRLPAHAALQRLCQIFGLSSFEQQILLLCAGVELESSLAALCAQVQGNAQSRYPTFSLALAALPDPHWNALAPNAPLRRWQLVELGPGHALTTSSLRIDERILHYLTGVQHLDERLFGLVQPLHSQQTLVPSHQAIADRITAVWSSTIATGTSPIIQLCGDELVGKQAIAHAACKALGLKAHLLLTPTLPTTPHDLSRFLRLWERESILMGSALILDCDTDEASDRARDSAIAHLISTIRSPLVVIGRDRRYIHQRPSISLDVHPPTAAEQQQLWQHYLGEQADPLNGHIGTLVAQFNLNGPTIQSICAEATPQSSTPQHLWNICRTQARPRLDDLAQRLESGAGWDDLVLPDAQMQTLREIAAHVRQRFKVYEHWGFGAKGGRGLGISALFAGPSGTGKTLAADVLAQELQLDLYRVDLSSIVSKYIGETEKNLRRIFDAAEMGGVILLFDEADALFGKRSEVKDSHDRHANIEVSYLLQRMEAYRGLAILTTNLKDSLDQAFLRRIRFMVPFPFPSAEQRAEIWRRVFPANTPVDGLEPRKLAKLNVAGGNIRNIALNAAFLAADADEPVRMKHLLSAARSEYIKLERPLTDAEVKGWVLDH